MQKSRAEQTRRELIRLCHRELDSRTRWIELIKRLRTVIPLDLSFFSTIDPATLLFTGAVVDDILLCALPQFLENEFLHTDVNKCAWMARSHTPVINLVPATEGELERSQRYREILAPLEGPAGASCACIVSKQAPPFYARRGSLPRPAHATLRRGVV